MIALLFTSTSSRVFKLYRMQMYVDKVLDAINTQKTGPLHGYRVPKLNVQVHCNFGTRP